MEVQMRQVRTVGGMVKVFPTKLFPQLRCFFWSCIIMKQTHSTSDCTSLCTSVLPQLNKWLHLCIFLLFITPSPYTSTSWQRILEGWMLRVQKWITEPTSQSEGLVTGMVLYKALTQQPIHWTAQKTLAMWQRVWWQILSFKNLWSMTWVGRMHKCFLL